jgi:hypothetical protein
MGFAMNLVTFMMDDGLVLNYEDLSKNLVFQEGRWMPTYIFSVPGYNFTGHG